MRAISIPILFVMYGLLFSLLKSFGSFNSRALELEGLRRPCLSSTYQLPPIAYAGIHRLLNQGLRFSEIRTSVPIHCSNRHVLKAECTAIRRLGAWRTIYESGMPRFKVKGALERSAAEDLWRHTLSRIPTLFGRIAYLASLRDPNSGIYRHHGLSAVFGRDESSNACARATSELSTSG